MISPRAYVKPDCHLAGWEKIEFTTITNFLVSEANRQNQSKKSQSGRLEKKAYPHTFKLSGKEDLVKLNVVNQVRIEGLIWTHKSSGKNLPNSTRSSKMPMVIRPARKDFRVVFSDQHGNKDSLDTIEDSKESEKILKATPEKGDKGFEGPPRRKSLEEEIKAFYEELAAFEDDANNASGTIEDPNKEVGNDVGPLDKDAKMEKDIETLSERTENRAEQLAIAIAFPSLRRRFISLFSAEI